MAKKKSSMDKFVGVAFPIVGFVFLLALFVVFYGVIRENVYWALAISGVIIIFFALLGYFNKGKFYRGIRRKFK